MKKFKRLCILLSVVLTIFTITACGGDGMFGKKNKDSIRVLIYEAGSGTEWLNKVAEEYKKVSGVTVKVDVSYVGGEIGGMLESQTTNADIVMPQGRLAKYADNGYIVELSDVYNAIPEGESKSIKDKMSQNVYKANLQKDGKIYLMNWLDTISTLMYNKSTLDKLFPGGYNLPRTTNELIEFAESINATSNGSVYPFSFSTSVGYLCYAHMTWWAQYEGFASYTDFYKGYYWDNGERKLAVNGETLDAAGREKALAVTSELWRKNAGYTHAQAGSMTYTEAQIAFVGQGYKGKDNKEVAMMMNGDWIENEMGVYLAHKPQDIRAMRLPMISNITENLSKSMDEATLRKVITAIDNGETTFAGVEQSDFDRIKEARLMVYSQTIDHPLAIPSTSVKQQQAKDFLVFLASDKGQAVYSKQLNGLTQSFGYKSSEVSEFVKSRKQVYGDDSIYIYSNHMMPMVWLGGLDPYTNLSGIDSLIYRGDTPASILSITKNNLMTNWDNIIKLAE